MKRSTGSETISSNILGLSLFTGWLVVPSTPARTLLVGLLMIAPAILMAPSAVADERFAACTPQTFSQACVSVEVIPLEAPIFSEEVVLIPYDPGITMPEPAIAEIWEDQHFVYPPGSPEPVSFHVYCIKYGTVDTCTQGAVRFAELHNVDIYPRAHSVTVEAYYADVNYCWSYWTFGACDGAVAVNTEKYVVVKINESP